MVFSSPVIYSICYIYLYFSHKFRYVLFVHWFVLHAYSTIVNHMLCIDENTLSLALVFCSLEFYSSLVYISMKMCMCVNSFHIE